MGGSEQERGRIRKALWRQLDIACARRRLRHREASTRDAGGRQASLATEKFEAPHVRAASAQVLAEYSAVVLAARLDRMPLPVPTREGLRIALERLRVDTAPGRDGIPARLLQLFSDSFLDLVYVAFTRRARGHPAECEQSWNGSRLSSCPSPKRADHEGRLLTGARFHCY